MLQRTYIGLQLVVPELYVTITFGYQTSDQNSPDNRFCEQKSSTCWRFLRPKFRKLSRFSEIFLIILNISNISNIEISQILPFPLKLHYQIFETDRYIHKCQKTHLVTHNLVYVWASPPVSGLIGRAVSLCIPYLLDRNFRQLGTENSTWSRRRALSNEPSLKSRLHSVVALWLETCNR